MRKIFLLPSLLITSLVIGQSWEKIDLKNFSSRSVSNNTIERDRMPNEYDLYSLSVDDFKNTLNLRGRNTVKTIKLPSPSGQLQRFEVRETSYLQKGLAAKFPSIKSYSAKGIDDPQATAKISIGLDGVHAMVSSPNHDTFYVDPHTKDRITYISYLRKSLPKNNFSCGVESAGSEYSQPNIENLPRKASTGVLKTVRFAMACTIEYSEFHLENQGVSSSESIQVKKAAVLSAMNTTITRVNQIYERDLSVRFVLVSDNDKIIFIDQDNLTNDDSDYLIDESQLVCDKYIGNDNYDIGHTVSTGGGGLAGVGVLCLEGEKGSGITGSYEPINDAYDVDFVAHEVGHQFGCHHTFGADTGGNCGGNRSRHRTAMEPGSGSTIMAYAGICDEQDIQHHTDDYFHVISLIEATNVLNKPRCANLKVSNVINNPPTADAGGDYSVPKSTPLVLRGIGTDQENDPITYCWEQTDAELAVQPPTKDNTAGPAFRSLVPTTSPNRYLPALPTVINGGLATKWEVFPEGSRDMSFALTVRDNHPGGGMFSYDDMEINITNSKPFVVTSQNSNVTWEVGASKSITWDKSDTYNAPINCKNVNIKLSTNGGRSFPVTLASNVPNNGSYIIVVPDNAGTSEARILVEAVDNIFYNVNSTEFTIKGKAAPYDPNAPVSEYCSSSFSSGEHIKNVKFNEIDNSSGDDPEGYGDYTSVSTNVVKGAAYKANVTIDADGFQDHCYIFIDWNQDGIFSNDEERYDLGMGTTVFLSKIKIPAKARLGSTRMRIVIEYATSDDPYGEGACSSDHNSLYGETEDYTLVILAKDDSASVDDIDFFNAFKLYPNPSTDGKFNLIFNLTEPGDVTIRLNDTKGRFIEEKIYRNSTINFAETVEFKKLSSGVYLMEIISNGKKMTKKVIVK